MLAARRGHKGNVKLLLAHPEIQVNLVDNDGWLALMLAAKYGHEDIVPLLLAHPQTLGLGQTSQASSAGPPTPVRQPTSVAIQTGLDLRTISLRSGSADASSSSIIVAEVFKNGSGDGSPGGEDMEDEGTNNHATHDEGADDQRAERESSGSKRTAKRCRGNEEDSLQGPFDDMAAPSPKRHCGAPVAEGSLPRRRTLNTPASKVVSSPTN
ncbi:hypothetical protein BKA70DRAFT_1354603 [Coprinopsis sp. MPI-PUGE-AT-0042]|nr:hypothetical protein BKA70DRAFT_1354603 [Coprinopsis sp. MPI-PUGE-AT-0042]